MIIRFFSDRKIPNKKKLLQFAEKICKKLKKLHGHGEISVIFVSDSTIKKLNQTYFQKNLPTDVIAFPYFSHESWVMGDGFKVNNFLGNTHDARLTTHDGILPFGDIYISLDTAMRQAQAGNHSLTQELALLILHGLLHLVGYEDEPPAKKRKMFQMQKKLFLDLAPTLAPPDILR